MLDTGPALASRNCGDAPGGDAARGDAARGDAARGDAAREDAPGGAAPRGGTARSLAPLLIDVGLPLGSYYLLRDAFGCSVVLSLALTSIIPAARTVGGIVTARRLNLLAGLMLAVNLAGIGVSFATGDPRMMIAKDSGISSVIAVAILLSVAARRPLMSAGLKPYMIKGSPARAAAWDRLSGGCDRFRRLELLFSAIWGIALLAECLARLVGAFTLPVATMVWLSSALTIGAIVAAIVIGSIASYPIEKMIDAEVTAGR
jgi:hypothetical protein